jgi:signal transduction histidine kinase/FixJ family two-component response regulator
MTKLYILTGPEKGGPHNLQPDVTLVGRAPDNDICIEDTLISRHHLQISQQGGEFFVKDLQSTNGTYVDGKAIGPGKDIKVKEAIPVEIGNTFISLGKKYQGDLLPDGDYSGPKGMLSDTLEMDRPKTSLRNLELMYKVSSVLMQSLDLNTTLEKIMDCIFDLLKRVDRGAVILADEETGRIRDVIWRVKPESVKACGERVYSRSVVERVMKEAKAVIMSNIPAEPREKRSESMELMQIKSLMCLPLVSKSMIRGAIYVDSIHRPYGFRKEDLSLMTALCTPAAIAIENAMLYASLEKMVGERTRNLLETQEKLKGSEARLKAIFDHMSSGVAVYEATRGGKDFKLVDVNDAYRRMEKVAESHPRGRSMLDVFPHYESTDILKVLRRVWKTGRPEGSGLTFFEGEEAVGWREYDAYRLPGGEIVVIIDDITEKKKAAKQQKVLQQQLFASQKMESIGIFAGGIAHNFRNILQAISGNTELLELLSGERRDIRVLSEKIYDSVEKGVDLINSLLHFSRKGGEYNLAHLDLADVIRQTQEVIGRVLNRSIHIESEVETSLFVKGNRSLLSQVFMNLFSNASDAMPNGGKLAVQAARQGDRIIATVTDTGIGMDEETLEKIFDPFFTLKEVGKGTGLGLSTVHGIIKEHKGTISVASKPGKGTTFTIALPCEEGEKKELDRTHKEIRRGKKEKILIVDDEGPALEALASTTRGLGYEAIAVQKPQDAVNKYEKWNPDVVLMDRGMPGMDGITCAKKIMEKYPDAKIIIVSGYEDAGPNRISPDMRTPLKGYIVKPCSMAQLGQAIARALEGRSQEAAAFAKRLRRAKGARRQE